MEFTTPPRAFRLASSWFQSHNRAAKFVGVVKEKLLVFVWLFHRLSGLLLVVLLPIQVVTGIYQGGSANLETARTMADLHSHTLLNGALAFLIIFHGLYGVRTVLLDLGLKREKLLFWICTALGTVGFAGYLYIFNTVAGT
jgi:succinate dehydrogenase/fumarate reductase cytochrome b subunit